MMLLSKPPIDVNIWGEFAFEVVWKGQ